MKGDFLLVVFKELSGTENSPGRGLWLPEAVVTGKTNGQSSVDWSLRVKQDGVLGNRPSSEQVPACPSQGVIHHLNYIF